MTSDSVYEIVYGVPEVDNLMADLDTRFKNNQLSKPEKQLFKKIVRCLSKLATNPKDTSLETHEIEVLSKKYAGLGIKIWESYIENRTPRAYRLFWYYHPDKENLIVIAGIEPHPEKGEYARLKLSVHESSK